MLKKCFICNYGSNWHRYSFQIETVKKNQEAVKKALQDLENAKTEEEIDKCRQVVQEVREKSEQSVMVLQVCLMYDYST